MCGCTALVAGVRLPPPAFPRRHRRRRRGFSARSEASMGAESPRKKVAVAGAGWAGLATAHHLLKQGYDVTLLGTESGPTEEVGLRGFWYPYRNIFSLVDELGISPFTGWNKAAYYSPRGLAVEFPIFHNQPRLPAPFGVFAYPEFPNLPLVDRLTSVPVIAAVIDFDNTDVAWRKYDTMTARELFKMYGCSQRLYKEVFEPALQAALFAPGEQCSAAATLGMLYYYMLSHQENSDFLLCRGEVEEKIFSPWLKSLELKGLKFVANRIPTSLTMDKDSGCISAIVCGKDVFEADAFVSALGLSPLQSIVRNSPFLQSDREFANLLHLSTSDVVSIKLWFDKKITIPKSANVCSGFDDSSGWTFIDLTSIYDDYCEEPITIVEAEFYNASHLLPLSDEHIVSEAALHLTKCIQDFEGAVVTQQSVRRSPGSVTNFLPGSYKYTLRGSTSFPNLFVAGDWMVNRHGSFSKEKAYVTGLEAANRVVDYFGSGDFAKIIGTLPQVLQEFTEIRHTIFSRNFAANATVTASSVRGGKHNLLFAPSNVLEDSIYSYWAPQEGQTCWELFFDLGQLSSFNVLQLQEPIQMGQRVIGFHLDILVNNLWQKIVEGTTIGYKRLLQFPVAESRYLKLSVDKARADPLISFFGVFMDPFSAIYNLGNGVKPLQVNSSEVIMRRTDRAAGNKSTAAM